MDFLKEKERLKLRYGHNKVVYAVHLFGCWCKSLYHRKPAKVYFYGKDNSVSFCPQGFKIAIWGNNNRVEIDPSVQFCGLLTIGIQDSPVNNCLVKIGANSTANGVDMALFEDNSSVIIGEDCMFSWDIHIWNTDTHTIYDKNTKECLNVGRELVIEDHVWVGMNVNILKNTRIPKNSVVGIGSVVTKKFTEPNVVISGVPAKVVKRDINWSRQRVKAYLQQQEKEKAD